MINRDTVYGLKHDCQVSRNDWDSPVILAHVPVASTNFPEFSQTLTQESWAWSCNDGICIL